MSFIITTTGTVATVTFDDLGGRSFTHPVSSFDLSTEFKIDDIVASADVAAALSGGEITAVDADGNSIQNLDQLNDIQRAYNEGVGVSVPDITTDPTRQAFIVRQGSGANSDPIIKGQNDVGTDSFSVDGNGRVTATTFNDVPLTTGGVATNYLDETGNYSSPAGGSVSAVTGTAPIQSTGGSTPAISILAATTSAAGSLSAADKTKLDSVATGAQPGIVESLTTTGSGASTLIGTVLNVPTPTTVANDLVWDAKGDLAIGSGPDAAIRLAIGSGGAYLRSTGTNVEWSTTTLPNSATTGDILYASSLNNYDNLSPGTTGDVLTSNGPGVAPSYQTPSGSFSPVISSATDNQLLVYNGTSTDWENKTVYNTSSSQWSRSNTDPAPLPDGNIANGCTFFTPDDASSAGTSTYNPIPLAGGIEIQLAGTSGTMQIDITVGGSTTGYTESYDVGRIAAGPTRRGTMVFANASPATPYDGTADVQIDGSNYGMTVTSRGVADTIRQFVEDEAANILTAHDIYVTSGGDDGLSLFFKAGVTCADTVITGINLGNITGTKPLSETYTSVDWSLEQTAENWVETHRTALNLLNVRPLWDPSSLIFPDHGKTIRFCSTLAICNTINISAISGDLGSVGAGTVISNPFTGATGVGSGAYDHFLMPYVDQPYEGQYVKQNFRVNFELDTSGGNNTEVLQLSLRRFGNDSFIGSEIQIFRTPDEGSQQIDFVTYTASAQDPFALGGFYFLLRNDSGVTVNVKGNVGILLQNVFERPTPF